MNLKRDSIYEENLSNKLKELFKDSPYTHQDLATYIGMKNGTVSKYVYGTVTPSIEGMIKIAKFFNISLYELIGLEREDEITHEEFELIKKYRNSSYKEAINKLLDD